MRRPTHRRISSSRPRKNPRGLQLVKETVRTLTSDELSQVATGGNDQTQCPTGSKPTTTTPGVATNGQ